MTKFVEAQQELHEEYRNRGKVVWSAVNDTCKSIGVGKHNSRYVQFPGNHDPSPSKQEHPDLNRSARRRLSGTRYQGLQEQCVALRKVVNVKRREQGMKPARFPKIKGKYLSGFKSQLLAQL